MRWFYFYEPSQLGGRLIVKAELDENEVRERFGRCARIEDNGVVTFWRRP